jgi:hypothetical protein
VQRNGATLGTSKFCRRISIIADDPNDAAPRRGNVLPDERAPRMTERHIHRVLGRDRQQAARALNKIGYEATMRRIEREGA